MADVRARPIHHGRARAGRPRDAGSAGPLAIVMGDVDLVAALGRAGVRSAFLGFPDSNARFSRYVATTLPWIDPAERPDDVVAALLAFAGGQAERPVLFPQTDAGLLLVSRYRDRLAPALRFALADAALVEQLVDKGRFEALAEELGLPVPPAHLVEPSADAAVPRLELDFPLVVKPVWRSDAWNEVFSWEKAVHVESPGALAAAWPVLRALGTNLLLQEEIPGPESAIESYHAYAGPDGDIVAEFTGRKVRTFPPERGHSTAVEVTRLPDVVELGRAIFTRLRLSGVAKLDFKRGPDRRLHLLEVNPRFNLWHHPGAVAGVNLPALVYADLTGTPRPPLPARTRTVTWCKPLRDVRAARAAGLPPGKWLAWARSCTTLSGLTRDDPMPFLRGTLLPALPRRVRAEFEDAGARRRTSAAAVRSAKGAG